MRSLRLRGFNFLVRMLLSAAFFFAHELLYGEENMTTLFSRVVVFFVATIALAEGNAGCPSASIPS